MNIAGLKGKASGIWAKNKYYIIAGAVGVVLFIIICCCCMCKRKMKKKKKKDQEKIKLKGAKPGKKLKRIQPGKMEKKAMEELGSLKFVLRYDTISEMLMVTIMEAEDIPVHDLSGYAYSFVIAKALPCHGESNVEHKTRLVRAGFWPSFNDTIEFLVRKDELEQQTLTLYLFEMNRWTKQDGIGQLSMSLNGLGLLIGKEHVIKRRLSVYNPLSDVKVEAGSIQLKLEYDTDWNLSIEVVKADIIPADEDKEKEDSYVTISALNKDGETLKKFKTKTRKGTLVPDFGETFAITIPDNLMPDVTLKLKLKASRKIKLGSNPVIGEDTITKESDHWIRLLEQNVTQGWFPVYKPGK
eukprot:Seg907.3 transcript_id=Seg907.3/GoldUCD/mRNA.D3Y31 product=Synaptotagmin-9 protein_id=Seg907.3/GoldUCD/D3Y31